MKGFFGQLKHHLLVDVVGMHLAQINVPKALPCEAHRIKGSVEILKQ
jgi:hypothetical protein